MKRKANPPHHGGEVISKPPRLVMKNPWDLVTPPINEQVYRKIDPNDPAIESLAEDIRKHGLITPILVNREDYIISGNRRVTAACKAGLMEVACEVRDVKLGTRKFDQMLVAANSENREKTLAEVARESAYKVDPKEAANWIMSERLKADKTPANALTITEPKKRSAIVYARPLADAILNVVRGCSVKPTLRQVHYLLLNDPPVTNTQTGERYANTESCYKNRLTDVATRLRINGELAPDALQDPGRPFVAYPTYSSSADYMRRKAEEFGGDYRRNLMQTQPNFVVVAIEKQTQQALVEDFLLQNFQGVPLMVCRGFASVSAQSVLVDAFRRSGKKKMIIVALTDCDPAGCGIKDSLGKGLVEIGVDTCDFEIVDAGLTHAQAEAEGARPSPVKANERGGGKTKAANFARAHGGKRTVYELESIPPERLLDILDHALRSVVDADLFNAERDAEKRELPELLAAHKAMLGDFGR